MNARGWNNSNGYLKLWEHFDRKVLGHLNWIYRATPKLPDLILWASNRMSDVTALKHLEPSRYIIQFWINDIGEQNVNTLIKEKYRHIMTTSTEMKAFGPLQQKYPSQIVMEQFNISFSENNYQLLGGEIAMSKEEITIDENKVWSQVSNLAERFWSDSKVNWNKSERRNRLLREKFVKLNTWKLYFICN